MYFPGSLCDRLRVRWAGILAVIGWGMLTTSPVLAETPISPEARQHFRTGVALLRDPTGPKYEEAYLAFKAAYRASPSPKILGNLGLCALMLERDGEAIDAYRRYLDEVPDIGDEERAEIQRELDVLLAGAVPFTLEVSPPGTVTLIDERQPVKGLPVLNRYVSDDGNVSLRLRAGVHHVTIEREGFVAATLDVEAIPGSPIARRVTLEPVASDPLVPATEGASVWGEPPVIAGLVVTGALGVAMATTMGIGLATHADYEDARAEGDVDRGDALRRRGQALNVASDVLLGLTVASAVTTAGLVLFLPTEEATATVSWTGTGGVLRVDF